MPPAPRLWKGIAKKAQTGRSRLYRAFSLFFSIFLAGHLFTSQEELVPDTAVPAEPSRLPRGPLKKPAATPPPGRPAAQGVVVPLRHRDLPPSSLMGMRKENYSFLPSYWRKPLHRPR